MTSVVAGCAPCQARATYAATDPPTPPPAPAPFTGPTTRWVGPLAFENQVTGEMPRRVFKPNSLHWDNEPLPLSMVRSAGERHDGSVVVGKIETLTRGSKGAIDGAGDFDMTSVDGQEAARLVGEGRMNWASVVIDDMTLEVWVAKDLLDSEPALLLAAAGDPIPSQDGYEVVATLSPDDEIHVVTSARIRGATLVETSAISNAKITLESAGDALATTPPAPPGDVSMPGMMPDGETECSCMEGDPGYDPDCVCGSAQDGMTAAGAIAGPRQWAVQVDPPARFFTAPRFDRATPFTVTDEGWVYGHIAAWGTCHIAYMNDGECVQPPQSHSSYAYFHTGSVLTAERSLLASGRLTMGTKHAGRFLSAAAALAHYEDTGLGAADLRLGEDSYGIWGAGGLRPRMTRENVRELRASPLSGDWRRIGGHLEQIAVLAVNVAGFPIPRPEAVVASGEILSLTAAGLVVPSEPLPREQVRTGYRVMVPSPVVPVVDAAVLRQRVALSKFAVKHRHPVRST